jgi:hypothetical protein
MPAKIDFKVKYKELYKPSAKEIVIVEVPEFQFLMIDGMGSPGDSQEFLDAYTVLYPVAYKVKFFSKAKGKDYVVPPSEGLWWADDMGDFLEGKRDKWKWKLMLLQPDWITQKMIEEAIEITKDKKPEIPKAIDNLRLEKYHEGKSAQIMYIGPFKDEAPTIEKIHAFIEGQGGKFDGQKQKHHEIYLSDPRKSAPEKLKTVIRQPFV